MEVKFTSRFVLCVVLSLNTDGWILQSVKVHGKAYKSNCYLEWDVFEQGAEVELELTDDPTVTCGNGTEALPPSLSTGGYD